MAFKDNILNRLTQGNAVTGLEVVFAEDGNTYVNVIELVRRKDNIEIIKTVKNLSFDFETLKNNVSTKLPVVLVLSGKGIVNKKIGHGVDETDTTIFSKAFPNIKQSDFSVQYSYIDDVHSFLSLARQDMVHDMLNKFKQNGFSVIKLYLGIFPINFSIPLLNNIPNQDGFVICTNNYELVIKNGFIESIQSSTNKPKSNNIAIGLENINSENLVSYSAALSYFMGDISQVRLVESMVNKNGEEFKEKNLFQTMGKLMLACLISILLVNYFLFNYYYTKKNDLSARISSQINEINKVDTLKAELQKKRTFLNRSGFLSDSKTSFYADRIAASVPDGILLDEMNIEPLLKKAESDTTNIMAFKQDVILLSGTAKSSAYVGDWMKKLKKNDWVKNAELVSYDQDKELNEGRFNIELKFKR